MQGGGFTGPRRADHENQAVGLLDFFFDEVQVVFVEPHFFERNGFAVGQDSQHRVFVAANRGAGGDPVLDGFLAILHFNLAILRHPAFGNVELGHDLDARDDGLLVNGGDFLVDAALSIFSEADDDLVAANAGFDMNIGNAAVVSVGQYFVDEPHDGAICFADGACAVVKRIGHNVHEALLPLEGGEQAGDRFGLLYFAAKILLAQDGVQEIDDVHLEPDLELNLLFGKDQLDVLVFVRIVGVVG